MHIVDWIVICFIIKNNALYCFNGSFYLMSKLICFD